MLLKKFLFVTFLQLRARAARGLTREGASSPGPRGRLDSNSQLGRVIGGFQLLDVVGQGAFGCVYFARKVDNSQQEFALKELQPETLVCNCIFSYRSDFSIF